MNIYIGVLSLLICTFFGYRLSVKYKDRKNFFTDFISFNEKMINEVSFSQNSLLSIVEKEKKENRDFGKLLYEKITDNDIILPKYLKEDEAETLFEYVNNLGKSDRESQLTYLSAKKKVIDELRVSAENEAKKYGNLYIKLGFLTGLIIFVALL